MRFVVLAVAMLTGCSLFMRSIETPTAEVRGVSVSSAGFTGVTGELALDVMNPNSFGVPLSGIDWQLSIGGTRAVTVTYLVPVFAVAWAWMILGEQPTWAMAVAGALILGSVALSQARR